MRVVAEENEKARQEMANYLGVTESKPSEEWEALLNTPAYQFDAFAKVLEQFRKIAVLPARWDDSGAEQPDIKHAQQALDFLKNVISQGVRIPWLIPQASGGIELDWVFGDLEVDILFEDHKLAVITSENGEITERPFELAEGIVVEAEKKLG